jgi:hypothetical protein
MDNQGEKIKCLSNFQAPELVVGKIYTAGITRKNVHGVWQVEVEGKWYIHDRFELVSKEQPQGVPPSHVALGDELAAVDVTSTSISTEQEWTDKHYDNNYTLTQKDIERGFVKIDPYFVSKMWKIGSKDDSGALWHCFKTIARFGEKNSREREIKALYAQIKCLAEIEGVSLDE